MNKKIIFTIGLAIIVSINATAQEQPPNAGFENWEVVGVTAEDPVDWSSPNVWESLGLKPLVFKTSDAHSGNFALRTISDTATILPPFGMGELDTVVGVVLLGPPNFDYPGIPYTDRPNEIKAWIKGTVSEGDSCSIQAELSKWDAVTNSRQSVGIAAHFMTSSINDYTEVTIPFDYILSDLPDTLTLAIFAGNANENEVVLPGNEFFVDDVSLTAPVGTNEIESDIHFLIHPNPFDISTTLTFHNPDFSKHSLTLYDNHGQIVRILRDITAANVEIERSGLSSGLYFFHLIRGDVLVGAGKIAVN